MQGVIDRQVEYVAAGDRMHCMICKTHARAHAHLERRERAVGRRACVPIIYETAMMVI
jgi:hypothetical protein